MTVVVYSIGVGYDMDPDDLTELDPQPIATPGFTYARRSIAASGRVVDEKPHVKLLFDLPLTVSQVQDLYEDFGVDSDTTSPVTYYGLNLNNEPTLFNGIAVRPLLGEDGERRGFFFYGLTFLIKNLREIV